LKSKSLADREEWFVQGLEREPLPVREMLALLAYLFETGESAAQEWAELLQERLADSEQAAAMLDLLELRLRWSRDDGAFRAAAAAACAAAFPDRLGQALVGSSGFAQGNVPPAECLRRVRLLTGLTPGAYCRDKTWGFGVVKRLDDFYKKITIDFDERRNHQMTFEYAAETLERLHEEHLMVRRHRDPEGLAALVRDDPSAVVRIALESYGPVNAGRLRELLVPAVLPDADWKRFWDAARKSLKADPLVDIPARRNDPILLRTAEKRYDDAWFAAFGAERDIRRLIELIREWEAEGGDAELTPRQRLILSDRIGFCIKGSEWQRPERVAWLLLAADRFGFAELPEHGGEELAWHILVPDTAAAFFDEDRCARAVSAMPARDTGAFLDYLRAVDREQTVRVLLDALDLLSFAALSVVIRTLNAWERRDALIERLGRMFEERRVRPTVVGWACLHLDQALGWGFARTSDLLVEAIGVLGTNCMGEDLKAQNQLVDVFADPEWLKHVLDQLDDARRRNFLKRVRALRGLDPTQQRSIMARIIKLYPELEATMEDSGEQQRPARKLTSWRSYNARRRQLKQLTEVEIPKNSREIALARSYGDLSENHEYKAAKEQQGILMRRQAEFEHDLQEVQGSDFERLPSDKAGPGTCVELVRPDGTRQNYCILGEWDRDEALGIISSRSRMAEMLSGKRAGEAVELPARESTTGATEPCRVDRVGPLSDAVRAWIRANASNGARGPIPTPLGGLG